MTQRTTHHPSLRLSPSEAQIARLLAEEQGVTYAATYQALYGRAIPQDAPAHTFLASARVIVHRLRGKFAATGYRIYSERGMGWYVSPEGQRAMGHWLATGRAPGDEVAA